jgi:hypothetical protein
VSPADTVCLRVPITESEYFLVVNRVHDTNFDSLFTFTDLDSNRIPDNTDSLDGAEFDWFMTDVTNPYVVHADPNYGGVQRRFVVTGSGVYVWHIDENVIRQMVDTGYLPNDFASQKGVDLEEADGVQDMDGVNSVFSFGSHYDSFHEGNNATFGPGTNPNSASNAGGATGLTIRNISKPDSFMTMTVEFSKPYTEVRKRWTAAGAFQPPTMFDLDGTGGDELVVFADTGQVYAFRNDGTEFVDKDSDPATIQPYFSAPGAVWVGPPAFGDVDGGGDGEIVATSRDGRVYAWKGDSTEVADGDGNPLTRGVLYQGSPMAAPPLLVDVTGDNHDEVLVVESSGDSLFISFVDAAGNKVRPADAAVQPLWPAGLQAQACSPAAYGALGEKGSDTEGIVLAYADSIRSVYGLVYIPTAVRSGSNAQRWEKQFAWTAPVRPVFPATSAPVVGDMDADGFDEVALTLPDARLVIADPSQGGAIAPQVVALRAPNPSSPALGDVDGNGTLEIALWDADEYYLYEHNGSLRTNWPQPVRANSLGSLPPLSYNPILASPLIGNFNGDSAVEIMFPLPDGSLHAFHADGTRLADYPRPVPARIEAAPAVGDPDGNGELSVVALGILPLLRTYESVSDTIVSSPTLVLSIQSLPGSDAQGKRFWSMYQHDPERQGRVTESNPLKTSGVRAEASTFIVYPNPVRGNAVHARIILNQRATVRVEIYNLEGERAVSARFDANPGNVIQTPFDETIDVSKLDSGVYIMRVAVGSDAYVKTFAIVK